MKIGQETNHRKTPRFRLHGDVIFVVSLVIFAISLHPGMVISDSMAPTLATGDHVIVDKLLLKFRSLHRSDLITFQDPEAVGPDYVKRLIGLPGETISVTKGQVYVNGVALEEPYLTVSPEYELGPVMVPPDHVFVLGDNRNISHDSHIFGAIPLNTVHGHLLLTVWPLKHLRLH